MVNKESECLRKTVHTIKTLDPREENYKDLKSFKKAFKDVDIVLLGEQTHGDGSTYEAKSRMVKFLHDEMNFDVLVFESGIVDCQIAWNTIKSGNDPFTSFGKGVFNFWAVSDFTTELIKYIASESKTTDPLILSGFDMQFSGRVLPKERADEILKFMNAGPEKANAKNYPLISDFLVNPVKYYKNIAKLQIDSVGRDALLSEFNNVAAVWESSPWDKDNSCYYRFFVNTPDLLKFVWYLDVNKIDPGIANIRDRVMAENLIWLKESLYKDKKLILWGANSHFGYNRIKLNPPDSMIPMGQYLKDRYGSEMFSLAFTSFDGEIGSIIQSTIEKVPEADSSSLELKLANLGIDYAFIDFRKSDNLFCLGNNFIARPYGYRNWEGEWPAMADGMFFIKTMVPNKPRK
jgi:erythromycin esterase